jgi:hypothetical protein
MILSCNDPLINLIEPNLNENDIYCVLLSVYHFCDEILCLVLITSTQHWFWSDSNLTSDWGPNCH